MSLARRLFIGFLFLAAVSVLWWLILPSTGLDAPVWILFLGFAVIAAACLLPLLAERPEAAEDELRTPDPGPSESDLRQYGE